MKNGTRLIFTMMKTDYGSASTIVIDFSSNEKAVMAADAMKAHFTFGRYETKWVIVEK